MTTESVGSPDHYWYGEATQKERSIAVLEAMRTYRAAETAMRRRTQVSMGMGETDLLALRYLIRAHSGGKTVGPKELAAYLGISSASTTALLDRLERSGHIERQPSPFDRRALIILPTVATDEEVRSTLGQMHERMMEAAHRLDPAEARVVIGFLDGMREAVDQIDAHIQ
jgi:DNA-binding MarR family transcriptional regulator